MTNQSSDLFVATTPGDKIISKKEGITSSSHIQKVYFPDGRIIRHEYETFFRDGTDFQMSSHIYRPISYKDKNGLEFSIVYLYKYNGDENIYFSRIPKEISISNGPRIVIEHDGINPHIEISSHIQNPVMIYVNKNAQYGQYAKPVQFISSIRSIFGHFIPQKAVFAANRRWR